MLRTSLLLLVLAAAARGQAPTLSADTQLPAVDTTFTVTLEGTPGATFLLLAGFEPAQVPLGGKGTLYLAPGAFFVALTGTLPPAGSFALPIPLTDDPEAVGLFFYLQGATKDAGQTRLGNALAFRITEQVPSGGRGSSALAVAPDGGKAWVTHERDGTLSAVDLVTGAKIADHPVGFAPDDVAVDPDGSHLVVVNRQSRFLTVMDAGSESVVAQLPVPEQCRRAAFDGNADPPRLYVTSASDDTVLVLEETAPGAFTALAPLAVTGRYPGPLAVLPDGRLAVGTHGSPHRIEILDPFADPAGPPDALVGLDGLPHDVLATDDLVIVSLFGTTAIPGSSAGSNKLLLLDGETFATLGPELQNVGTDYVDVALAPPFVGVVGAGSGTGIVADAATFASLDVVDLAPGQPNATPERGAITVDAAGDPQTFWVLNRFRETLAPIDLTNGPPFALGAEVPLAWDGEVRVALASLTPEEDGAWFFKSVQFLNGTPLDPNNVTCATCHPDGGTDTITRANQVPSLFGAGATAPYGWTGGQAELDESVTQTFFAHSQFGGQPPPGSVDLVTLYLTDANPWPPSPHLPADGQPGADALAGKALFEGAAGCSACHEAPDFVPASGQPETLPNGVGTGLAPANIPTLRAIWASAPYLHDGSAPTLLDVLELDTGDEHGTTSTLTATERGQLVAYLLTL